MVNSVKGVVLIRKKRSKLLNHLVIFFIKNGIADFIIRIISTFSLSPFSFCLHLLLPGNACGNGFIDEQFGFRKIQSTEEGSSTTKELLSY